MLSSVGGFGVKGRGEGVVWVGEPLWASDSVKRKGVPEFLKVHFGGISDVLFCAQESQNLLKARFLRKSSAPGSEPARDKWLVQGKSQTFEKKRSARGSEAARDKCLVQKNRIFENKFCPMQRSCPGQVVC